ncbi:MAG: hypothetical protein ACK41T_05905 [Pseudobdellovibrio sp.]
MKAVLALFAMLTMSLTVGAQVDIKVPEKVNGYKVLYAGVKSSYIGQQAGHDLYAVSAILQLGTSVYKTGKIIFMCYSYNDQCVVDSFQHVASYKDCVVSDKAVSCIKPISGRDMNYDASSSGQQIPPHYGWDSGSDFSGREYNDPETSIDYGGDRTGREEEFPGLF